MKFNVNEYKDIIDEAESCGLKEWILKMLLNTLEKVEKFAGRLGPDVHLEEKRNSGKNNVNKREYPLREPKEPKEPKGLEQPQKPRLERE